MEATALRAHTPPKGTDRWHALADHLRGTSQRAAHFAEPFGAGRLAGWSGLCHDIGKAHPAWQQYLREAHRRALSGEPKQRPTVRHKLAGAALALERDLGIVGAVILGHHGGLPDGIELKLLARTARENAEVSEPLRTLGAWLAEAMADTPTKDDIPAWARRDGPSMECFGRMLYSCLVDADSLDTEAHAHPDLRATGLALEPKTLLKQLDAHRAQLRRDDAPMQAVRETVYQACVDAACGPRGFYRLAAPTGAGKTFASLGFALTHAAEHRMDRVIVALPYTTIIEQTVDAYRKVFGDGTLVSPLVLEHHSAMEALEKDEEGTADLQVRLATENWDAPIVVTTTVQLFESLFSNRRSACRKLHRIARSIIILDEAQTLPVPLLSPTLHMLRELVDHYGVSVLLSTATQPALGDGALPQGLPEGTVRDVLADPSALFVALRRVDYEVVAAPWTWEQAAAALSQSHQGMAVVNTRAHALALLDALGDPDALHLSTYLCGAHRRQVLEDVHRRLASGQSCRLVATQVVEAGVDVDFPLVLRAMGPLDRIVQAAGRCNREGKLPRPGRVVVFEPEDEKVPRGVYARATEIARAFLRMPDTDLHDPRVYEAYFRQLYSGTNTDAQGIQSLRQDLDYPRVAHAYRLMPEDTVAVAVPFGEGPQALADLEHSGPSRQRLRRLQPFTVSVHRWQIERLEKEGLVREIPGDLRAWVGTYDHKAGIGRFAGDPAALVVG